MLFRSTYTYWHAGCTLQNYPPRFEAGEAVITLSNNRLYENNRVGQFIGRFNVLSSVSDAVIVDNFVFALVSGAGDTDNAFFNLLSGSLFAAVVFDSETKTNFSIRVKATNSGGISITQIFNIVIKNQEDIAPTDILLTPAVTTTGARGRFVGTLSAVSPSPTDVFTFFLASGAGSTNNNEFAISGLSLFTAVDMPSAGVKTIRIRVQNNYNITFEKALNITVTS